MKKADLTTALNGFIDPTVNITKHRNANNAMVDEFYPTPVIDSYASQTYTNNSGNVNLPYNIKLTKSGRKVTLDFSFSNAGSSVLFAPTIFTFKAGQYFPETFTVRGIGKSVANNDLQILVSEAGFKIGGAFPTSITYYGQITYNTAE